VTTAKRADLIAAHLQCWKEIIQLAIPWIDAIAAAQGVHPTDLIATSYLHDVGPATAGRLAEITGLTTGAMTACIDRLEREGFARREADSNDRRRVMIKHGKLPKLSKELLAFRANAMKEAEDAFWELTDAEIAKMTKCMQELATIFEKEGHEFKKSHRKSMTRKKDTKPND
jgi:DNA-binding MarR family transcriptional regulator